MICFTTYCFMYSKRQLRKLYNRPNIRKKLFTLAAWACKIGNIFAELPLASRWTIIHLMSAIEGTVSYVFWRVSMAQLLYFTNENSFVLIASNKKLLYYFCSNFFLLFCMFLLYLTLHSSKKLEKKALQRL